MVKTELFLFKFPEKKLLLLNPPSDSSSVMYMESLFITLTDFKGSKEVFNKCFG